jgi:hypothetical protein
MLGEREREAESDESEPKQSVNLKLEQRPGMDFPTRHLPCQVECVNIIVQDYEHSPADEATRLPMLAKHARSIAAENPDAQAQCHRDVEPPDAGVVYRLLPCKDDDDSHRHPHRPPHGTHMADHMGALVNLALLL